MRRKAQGKTTSFPLMKIDKLTIGLIVVMVGSIIGYVLVTFV